MILNLLFLIQFFSKAEAVSLDAVQFNKEGIAHLKNEEEYLAYKKFINGLAIEPFSPELHMNLGLSFELNKEEKKALKEYRSVYRMKGIPEELKFHTLFNMARVHANEGNIDKALKKYQAALEFQPDSIEVKTNIELLWQMQQGKGKGGDQDSKNKEKSDEQNDNQQDQQQSQNPKEEEKKKQPKPFESRELTKDDVRKILEEIKSQENQIRAKDYGKSLKEKPREKDW